MVDQKRADRTGNARRAAGQEIDIGEIPLTVGRRQLKDGAVAAVAVSCGAVDVAGAVEDQVPAPRE